MWRDDGGTRGLEQRLIRVEQSLSEKAVQLLPVPLFIARALQTYSPCCFCELTEVTSRKNVLDVGMGHLDL